MSDAVQQLAPAGSSLANAASFTTADASSLTSRTASQKAEGAFAGQPSFSFGPLDVHAGSLVRQFRFRQKFDLADRLEAAAGLFYDLHSSKVGPTASLIYRLDKDKPKSRIELSTLDRKLLLRKGWEVKIKKATVGLSAEASLNFEKGEDGKSLGSIRPDLHLSLDHVKPFKYELIGIGLVLLLNMPIKLNNKEGEVPLPWGLGRLKGFGRASIKRDGYMHWKLGCSQACGVLDM